MINKAWVKYIYILLAGAYYFTGSQALALSCVVNAPSYTLNIGAIIVQRDMAIGQPLTNTITGSPQAIYGCTTSGGEGYLSGIKTYLTYVATYSNSMRVYQTNIPGIGISIGGDPHTCDIRFIGQTGGVSADAATLCISSSHAGSFFSWNINPIVQLFKTGSTGSGSISGSIADFYSGEGNYNNLQPEVPIYISGSITTVACSISTPNILVPLEDVLASNLTAVGTIAKPQNFNVGLNCDAGANINAQLTGTSNTDTDVPGVLQLSNTGSANVATGVGIQIFYNGSPMLLNQNMVLKTSSGGQETFPFTAQYYQTKTTVTSGSANATATLILTYQ